MDPFRVGIRAAVTFLYLLVMLRISGKQVIPQSTPFDFVLSLILGDLIDDFLFSEVSASEFVIATASLVFADLTVKYLSFRNASFWLLVNGKPTILIKDGKEDKSQMATQLVNDANLLALLRLKSIDEENRDDVENAILEYDGEASVLKKHSAKTVQKRQKESLRKQIK